MTDEQTADDLGNIEVWHRGFKAGAKWHRALCTCGGEPGQPASHHDISCPAALTEHEEIWLQPWCGDCELRAWDSETSRQWCKDNVWDDCVVCGAKPVKYAVSRRGGE